MSDLWPVTVALGVVLAFGVAFRLKLGAQPLRLELAEKGEQLLASQHASDDEKEFARRMLDTTFSDRFALIAMFFVVPVFAFHLLVRSTLRDENDSLTRTSDPETRVLFDDVFGLHCQISFANHPLLVPLMLLWLTTWGYAALAIRTIVLGVMPKREGTRLMFGVADRAHRISMRFGGHHAAAG